MPAILVLGCLVFSYWATIQKLVAQWLRSDDYSYGLLIVPIVIYLIWQKRTELKTVNLNSDWRALPVVFFAILVCVVGELGSELFTIRVSMLIFVIGLIWFIYGFKVLKVLRFPLAFLFLMLPLPGFIYRNLTFPLQIFSSIWSVKILHRLGISAYREGNVIDIGYTQLQVVDACNGLRYILPLFTLGILFCLLCSKADLEAYRTGCCYNTISYFR
jgi:exosortase